MKKNTHRLIILIVILIVIASLATYLIYIRYLAGNQKGLISQQLSSAEKSQYKFMSVAKDASVSAGQTSYAQKYHQYWRGRITYLPLSDSFVGTVDDSIDNIQHYRLAKKLVTENLKEMGINTCDLNIIWLRPDKIDKDSFEAQDVRTDGCTER